MAPYQATDAIGYGWKKFQANVGPMLVMTLITMVVIGIIAVLGSILTAAIFGTTATTTYNTDTMTYETSGGGFLVGLLANVVVSFLIGVLAYVFAAALFKGALDITRGQTTSLGQMFEGWDKGKVIVAALLVSLITSIGTLLCYLPGLVAGFFLIFTIPFVVARGLAPVEALKASFELVKANLGQALIWYLLTGLVMLAGAIVCGVGLLAAVPIAFLGMAYTFLKLQNEPVAP